MEEELGIECEEDSFGGKEREERALLEEGL